MKKRKFEQEEDAFLEETLLENDNNDLENLDIDNSDKKNKKNSLDKNKENYYVDPKEFDNEIINYYTSGVISNNLAEMISKISNKLSYAPNFINYTFREEMVGDGIVRMFKALTAQKYSHTKGSNPFSYFTRIAFNAFRNRIKKEKHSRETLEKYQEELALNSNDYNTVVKNNQFRITKDRDY